MWIVIGIVSIWAIMKRKSPLKITLGGAHFFDEGTRLLLRNLFSKNMKGKTKIEIQGHLYKKWKNSFEGMKIRYEGNIQFLQEI